MVNARDYSSVFYGGRSAKCSSATECKNECDHMYGSGGKCGSDYTGMCYCNCKGSGGWSTATTLHACYDYCFVAYVSKAGYSASAFPRPWYTGACKS